MLDRGLPARRDRAPRPRPRRLPRAQPPPRLRPHDRLGPGRPVRAGRRPRHQLHRARRRARATRPGRARSRRRRSTSSATSAAAACCWPSASCARCSRRRAPVQGQVVDAAMVDGVGRADDHDVGLHGHGHLDATSAAPTCSTPARHFYDTYETADGKFVSIGSHRAAVLRRAARAAGLAGLEAERRDLPHQMDRDQWPELKERPGRDLRRPRPATSGARSWRAPTSASPPCSRWTRRPSTRTTSSAAPSSRWRASRSPRPAPRFSRTPGEIQRPPRTAGQHTDEVLADWLGLDSDAIASRRGSGAVA